MSSLRNRSAIYANNFCKKEAANYAARWNDIDYTAQYLAEDIMYGLQQLRRLHGAKMYPVANYDDVYSLTQQYAFDELA